MIDRKPRIARRSPVRTAGGLGRPRIGRTLRWRRWVRSIAERSTRIARLGRSATLIFRRRRPAAALSIVRYTTERTRLLAPIFSPRLSLSISPRLTLECRRRERIRSEIAAEPRQRRRHAASVTDAELVGGAVSRPLTMVLMRTASPGAPGANKVVGLPGGLHHESQTPVSNREWTRRLVERGRRRDAPPVRTAHRVFQERPSAPTPATVEESGAEIRRQRALPGGASARAGSFASGGSAVPLGAQEALPTPQQLERLTDQVVHRIDRRLTAWRERTGRV